MILYNGYYSRCSPRRSHHHVADTGAWICTLDDEGRRHPALASQIWYGFCREHRMYRSWRGILK